MASEIYRPSDKDIDAAGRALVERLDTPADDQQWIDAAVLVDAWRRSHSIPLQTFRANLRNRAGSRAIVAQRLKRLPSIIGKLQRLSRIRLSRMQDIGGCRVIMPTADEALHLAGDFAGSRIRHELVRSQDYINEPRKTGYRGIHLIYSYRSERRDDLNGLGVEIQLRSQLQHQWATAVETVGTYIGEDLKSGRGDPDWLRFFELMSAVIAHREGKPGVPNTPSDHRELVGAVQEIAGRMNVLERVNAFQEVTRQLPRFRKDTGYWHVLELDMEALQIRGFSFGQSGLDVASSLYRDKEVENRGNRKVDVVLVSADSVRDLQKAYPNYFTDIQAFLELLHDTLEAA